MSRAPHVLLYLNVLVIATCGLIYELLAGTLASYVLGDSVTQFSLVIGIYLSALGVGAWLSRFIEEKVARGFIETELAVALLGGASAPILFYAFGAVDWFRPLLYGMVFTIGTLVGLELPLLMRLLKDELDFSDLVSRVLMWDYIGALLASLLFPMLLVPKLGLVRTSLLFGMLNALVGLWGTYLLRPLLNNRGLAGLRGRAVVTLALLAAAFVKADSLTTLSEETVLPGTVIHAESSPYQRIVVTKNEGGFQLNLNGKLQFNSADEYRYHEALVHPPLSACSSIKHVLVLGGGDGLAVREILKYPGVESVTLVDLDPAMTRLAAEFPLLAELNRHALSDPRVSVINADAFLWVAESGPRYDAAIIDFPDPGTFSVGKLYTRLFYDRLRHRLQPEACISVQCTSPLVAPKSYWCIVTTMEASGYHVRPYHAPVPTFGIWGFVLASPAPLRAGIQLPEAVAGQLRFLNEQTLAGLFHLPADLLRVPSVVNRLDDQALVRFYDQEWSRVH